MSLQGLGQHGLRTLAAEFPLRGREPVDFFAAVRHEECPWLLETANLAGPSFIGSRPRWTLRTQHGRVALRSEGQEERSLDLRPMEALKALWSSVSAPPRLEGLPFTGGLVGYLGYDMAHCFERLPCTTVDDLGLPDAVFFVPSYVLCVEPALGRATLALQAWDDQPDREARRDLQDLLRRFDSAPPRPRPDSSILALGRDADLRLPYDSTYTREEYAEMVLAVKEYVAAGDIIQANISQRLSLAMEDDPLALYERLRAINPSPFAFIMDCGDHRLISCSPERLLERRGRMLQTRPIAGTRRRGQVTHEDEALRGELLMSEKERAEHIMLVDLERNDLGRACEYGTVRVDELMTVEAYSHVFHIVSNVVGRLREDRDSFDAIAATFPGGTITGCPKIRCMEIIDELERTRRGPYTGSAGYIGFDGDMDFNIIIRTFVEARGRIHVQVGGGIVADSDPDAEYEETMHKARALLLAAQGRPRMGSAS